MPVLKADNLTTHHLGPLSPNQGTLNFLEHSRPLQACNGTDLPFFLTDSERCFYKVDFDVTEDCV